jgi:hypothetical protein
MPPTLMLRLQFGFDVAVSIPPQGATDPQPIGAVPLTDLALDASNWRVRRPRVGIG